MNKKRSDGFGVSVARGIVIGLLVAMVGSILLAWGVWRGKWEPDKMELGVMIITVTAGIAGALAAGCAHGKRLLYLCGAVGLGEFLLLLVAGFVFPGTKHGVWETFLLLMGTCLAVAFVGFNGKKRKIPGHRRKRFG